MNHHIVMGRKTYETIGKALPGREMIVLSHQNHYQVENCLVVNSLESAIQIAKNSGEDELFIIGGGDVFDQSLEVADKIYLTRVHAKVNADVIFPDFDLTKWTAIYHEENIQETVDQYRSDFIVFTRKNKEKS